MRAVRDPLDSGRASPAMREQRAETARRAQLLTQVFTCPVPGCGGAVEIAAEWAPGNARPYCRTCALRAGDGATLPDVVRQRDALITELRAAVREAERVARVATGRLAGAEATATSAVRDRDQARAGHGHATPLTDAIGAFLASQPRPVNLAAILAGITGSTPASITVTVGVLARTGRILRIPAPPGSGLGARYLYARLAP